MELIARRASGFIYYVSREGVTGMQTKVSDTIGAMTRQIRAHTDLPIAVGFGISNAEQARAVAQHAEAIVVGPPEMSLLPEFKAELDQLNVAYREAGDVRDVISEADVIYMEPVVQADYTASRVEREGDTGLTPPEYVVTRQLLREQAKRSSIILHSLPRMDELPEDVDGTRHARYWSEAFNGVVMRMALISLVLGAME